MTKVAVISLGCDKNRVDTEHMLYGISHGGCCVCDVDDADVIIINTCAFIESARQESIDTILECAEFKKHGKCKKLIVTGCLPQKYRGELIEELPEVDAFLGAFEYDKINDIINGVDTNEVASCVANVETENEKFFCAENAPRLLTTYPHVAYLKIAEGCNNKCTFCTIPSIRGGYRSRALADVVKEANGLYNDGVTELILVAQDVTRYGTDIGSSLIELLTELEKIGAKIRLLYCYPEMVTDELIQKISSSPNILNYIDIPIQHCSDKILKLMNRRTTRADLEALIGKLHAAGIVVRTTLMVGFPNETDAEFGELCNFVRTTRPEYAGIFAYSKEDGTPAARLKGHVTKAVKRARVAALGEIATGVTREFGKSLREKTIDVVYEDIDYDKNMFIGRAEFQTPDVDGRVYFKCAQADVGKRYAVRITDSDDYDLYGEVDGDAAEEANT